MIEKAMQEFDIDLENSWMIGDKNLDVELGNNAKIKTALVLTGYGEKHLKKFELKPTIIANTLIEAVNEILKN